MEEPKPEPRKEVAKREEPPARNEAPGRVSTDEPNAGQTFLQVVATSRGDAQIVAESLAKKGFRAHMAAGPSATIFRVLVGPLPNAAEVAETRVRLEASGFKPIMRRY